MRKIVETVEGEGLEKFLGEKIQVWCMNYIYAGKLSGVNSNCILLTDASVVYETGELAAKGYKDAQAAGRDIYVMIAAIESFSAGK
jgi:homoserine acetyltransferase